MRKITKLIMIPCLVGSIAFTGLSIQKTLSIFSERAEYEAIIYPYDGRAALSATFSNGETTKEGSGDVAVTAKLTNTSLATVTKVRYDIVYPAKTVSSEETVNIPSGQAFDKALTVKILKEDALDVDWVQYYNNAGADYSPVIIKATPTEIKETGSDTAMAAVVPTLETTVYVRWKEAEP